MKTFRTQFLISLLVLLPVLSFAYFFSDTFGSTRIGVTIKTNPDLRDGLIGHWTFDGKDMDRSSTTAEVLDVSGLNENLNLFNQVESEIGVIGQALDFSGTTDYLISTSDTYAGVVQKTLCVWSRPDIVDSNVHALINRGTGAANGYRLTQYQDDIYFMQEFDTQNGEWNVPGRVVQDEWMHICLSYDRSSASNAPGFYINGELTTTVVSIAPIGTAVADANDLYIGAQANSPSNEEYDGTMDDVRFYNRILSANEIRRIYQLGATTKINKTLDSNPDLQDGLVGHITFDATDVDLSNTSNELTDRASSTITANLLNHSSTTYPGVLGQAFDFDGVDDYILWTGNSYHRSLDTFTVSVWIRPTGWGESDTGSIISVAASGNTAPRWQLRLHNSGAPLASFRAFVDDVTATDASAYTVAGSAVLNEWQHVVMTFDETTDDTIRIYKNGVELAYDSNTAGASTIFDSASYELWVGEENDFPSTSDEAFEGQMDDIRLYSRVISQQEITRLYQLGATTKVNVTLDTNPDLKRGLVGHWTFDGNAIDRASSTSEVKDVSGNENHGDWENHATTTFPGVMGQGLTVDGTDDHIDFGSESSFDDLQSSGLTAATWLYVRTLDDFDQIMSKGFGVSGSIIDGWNFALGQLSNGRLRFEASFSGSSVVRESEETLDVGRWYHVAATWTGSFTASDINFYIDGAEVSSYTASSDGSGSYDSDASRAFYIARNANGAPTTFIHASYDDTRLYNRVLSADEISRLYHLGQ